jgi:hypothetical protein
MKAVIGNQRMTWIAPVFLLTTVAIFVAAPWSLKVKLDAVCFGI